jgi:hypothetical protein
VHDITACPHSCVHEFVQRPDRHAYARSGRPGGATQSPASGLPQKQGTLQRPRKGVLFPVPESHQYEHERGCVNPKQKCPHLRKAEMSLEDGLKL